jgi:hypothetical protein
MRMRKLIGVTSLMKRFTIGSLACVCMVAIEMPAMAQQAPAASASERIRPRPIFQEISLTAHARELIDSGARMLAAIHRRAEMRD